MYCTWLSAVFITALPILLCHLAQARNRTACNSTGTTLWVQNPLLKWLTNKCLGCFSCKDLCCLQPDYGGMQQYVQWNNATGVIQQFYTDPNIQVSCPNAKTTSCHMHDAVIIYCHAICHMWCHVICAHCAAMWYVPIVLPCATFVFNKVLANACIADSKQFVHLILLKNSCCYCPHSFVLKSFCAQALVCSNTHPACCSHPCCLVLKLFGAHIASKHKQRGCRHNTKTMWLQSSCAKTAWQEQFTVMIQPS